MSFQAMAWAVNQPCKNSGEKLVLIMLANHCNSHTGQCNPSQKLLADECSMGVSTLKNHLQSLADAGLIEVVNQDVQGRKVSNQYLLKLAIDSQNLAIRSPESGYPLYKNLEDKHTGVEKFQDFWDAYPKGDRRVGKAECMKFWSKNRLDSKVEVILAHLEAIKKSKAWRDGFHPAILKYLKENRWLDDLPEPQEESWEAAGWK